MHPLSIIILIVFSLILFFIALLYRQLSKAKDKLEASNTKLQTIFDITMEAIIIYDENHQIKEVNKTTQRLFGYKQEELIGKNLLEFVAPQARERTIKTITEKLVDSYETQVIKKDGSIFPIFVSGRYITLEGKKVRVSILMDLTELKQTQCELQKLNTSLEKRIVEEVEKNHIKEQKLFQQSRLAQMGEMISMIAHQWRQPLSAIASTTTNIEAKISMDRFDLQTEQGADECKNFLEGKIKNINTYVQSLSSTIDDFRNFYSPHKEQKDVTISEPIEKAYAIMKTAFITHQINVIKTYQTDKTLSLYDNEFMQVILNILKNAQDQLVEKNITHPTIMIKTYESGEYIMIEISDNAGGIPPEYIETIFDPYFSTKDQKNGTGLGLYMSKVIVDDHHSGKISVHNNEEGAVFTIAVKSDIMHHKKESLELETV